MPRAVLLLAAIVLAAALAAKVGGGGGTSAPPATPPPAPGAPAPEGPPVPPAPPPPAPPPDGAIFDIGRPSKETCGGCHADVLAEWAPTLHARAWTNDNILRETRNFETLECRPCHSPEPVLPHALELSPRCYRPPDFRPVNVEDGVHCLSCHGVAGGGGVAALRDVPDAPCRPRRDARLLEPAFCATCHDPTHQAAEEWWVSPAMADGDACQDCHMERVGRAGGRRGRSHVFPGGFDRAQVQRSVTITARVEAGAVLVTFENRAGHKLPGEIPSRALTIGVEAFDAAGARVLDTTALIRRPFKSKEERLRPDDRLLPGETRTIATPLPPPAARAVVTAFFRSLPLQPDRHAIPLGRFELPVPK